MRHIVQVMGYIGYPAKALGGINNGLGLVFDNSGGIFALDHGFFYGFIDGGHELLDVFHQTQSLCSVPAFESIRCLP